jgi:hypothetical protein
MKTDERRPEDLGVADASPPRPALRLLEAQRRVTYTLSALGRAQRLRDDGFLSPVEYESRALAHAVAERELTELLRWLNATE